MASAHTLTSEDIGRWQNLPTESCTFFQTYSWNQFLTEVYSYPDLTITLDDTNDTGNAFLPLKLVKSRLFGSRLISTPFSDQGGPTKTQTRTQKLLLWAAREKHNRLKTDFLEIRLSRYHSSELYPTLDQLGFKQIHDYRSFLIDLKEGKKQTWNRISQSTRRAIKKSQQAGIEVREARSAGDIQSYHQLHLSSSREHGAPAHPLKFFTKMYKRLNPQGQMKLLLAAHKQHDVAGLLLLRRRPTVHYWQSALPSKYRYLNPFHELLWDALTSSTEENFDIFDLGRTRRETGVYRFKRTWGGVEYELDHYCFFTGKPPKLADPETLKYRAASAVWKRIPKTILNKVDSRIIREIAL